MEKNTARLKDLRNEFIDIIEKVAKSKLTLDNEIVFNNPIYVSSDTYWDDRKLDAMIIGDIGQVFILAEGHEDIGSLVSLTTETLAEIADIIECGNYEIVE